MVLCYICGRPENVKSRKENISFHRFPANKPIFKKWLEFVIEHSLDASKVTKTDTLCSAHFNKEYIFSYRRQRFLCKAAVPTLSIPHYSTIIKYTSEESTDLSLSGDYNTSQNNKAISVVQPNYIHTRAKPQNTITNVYPATPRIETVTLQNSESGDKVKYEEMSNSSQPITTESETVIIINSDSEDDSRLQVNNIYSHPLVTESTSEVVSSLNTGHFFNSTSFRTSTSFNTTDNDPKKGVLVFSVIPMPGNTSNEIAFKKSISRMTTELLDKTKRLRNAQQTIRRQRKRIKLLQSIIDTLKRPNSIGESDNEAENFFT
ncbi:uncharacterized protein LOC126836820 [Adelges cooleyi]|uniref:uncharacterized protein LOC126836820 n=1 Tax=Adelges cooleyi TaxID=133065 RepID=UPI00217F568D|nr:uncharacterized protein LOC126836820 [Adelges cooleyi]